MDRSRTAPDFPTQTSFTLPNTRKPPHPSGEFVWQRQYRLPEQEKDIVSDLCHCMYTNLRVVDLPLLTPIFSIQRLMGFAKCPSCGRVGQIVTGATYKKHVKRHLTLAPYTSRVPSVNPASGSTRHDDNLPNLQPANLQGSQADSTTSRNVSARPSPVPVAQSSSTAVAQPILTLNESDRGRPGPSHDLSITDSSGPGEPNDSAPTIEGSESVVDASILEHLLAAAEQEDVFYDVPEAEPAEDEAMPYEEEVDFEALVAALLSSTNNADQQHQPSAGHEDPLRTFPHPIHPSLLQPPSEDIHSVGDDPDLNFCAFYIALVAQVLKSIFQHTHSSIGLCQTSFLAHCRLPV